MLSPDPAWPAGTSAPRCRCVRKGVDSGKSSPYRMAKVAYMDEGGGADGAEKGMACPEGSGFGKILSLPDDGGGAEGAVRGMVRPEGSGFREKSSPYRMARVAHMDDVGGADGAERGMVCPEGSGFR